MALFKFSRKRKPDSEIERRERLLKNGRITEGRILDCDDEITQVFYIYSINGADYESSELLTAEQRLRTQDYAPGAKVSIRYDPRQPGNSIVV
ncbi:MAG TPA: hypothetical protein VGB02_04370 [Pyrinomonadaceae bacterium]|jgi:hypothetical protein